MSPANRYGCGPVALISPLWAFGGLTAPARVARVPGMQSLDIAASFVTTFLGVLLAFGLENARQRRRTNHWVRQHLGHLRASLAEEVATGGQVDAVIAAQVSDGGAVVVRPDRPARTTGPAPGGGAARRDHSARRAGQGRARSAGRPGFGDRRVGPASHLNYPQWTVRTHMLRTSSLMSSPTRVAASAPLRMTSWWSSVAPASPAATLVTNEMPSTSMPYARA